MIQRGSCWRVGDRRSINIWQHRWLPIKHPTKIASPMVETMDEATVDCLIDAEKRCWIDGKVDGLFIVEQARLIKKIPLARVIT